MNHGVGAYLPESLLELAVVSNINGYGTNMLQRNRMGPVDAIDRPLVSGLLADMPSQEPAGACHQYSSTGYNGSVLGMFGHLSGRWQLMVHTLFYLLFYL